MPEITDYFSGQHIDCQLSCDVPEQVKLLQASEQPMSFSRKCPNEGCPLYVRVV